MMTTNLHTHTTFCDGKNTPEEIVLYAIDKGARAIGFSGHGYTPYDLRYCMKDTPGYINEIRRLQEKYKNKIQIYCGSEEDAFNYVKRTDYDYIIGSSHYFNVDGKYYPIDSGYDYFRACLEAFEKDAIRLANTYYENFVSYIADRKPDIVGHFDLITKFDEAEECLFMNNSEYLKIAEKYIGIAAENDVIFEVNTGAISRGYRKTPYPQENLLYVLKEKDCKITLSSDSHSVETLDFYFNETESLLRDLGFRYVYEMDCGRFVKRFI